MTGYGRSRAVGNGNELTVEITTLNRRQLDITFVLPQQFEPLEPRLRQIVAQHIDRGRVVVRVTLRISDKLMASYVRLNKQLAKAYLDQLKSLNKLVGINDHIRLEHLLHLPGVVQLLTHDLDPDYFWKDLSEAMNKAINQVIRMREREGNFLAKDVRRQVSLMRKLTDRIRQIAPRVGEQYRQHLIERLKSLKLSSVEASEPIAREIALLVERHDITEELTRLESHFQQFETLIQSNEPVGRTLDFLAQEIQREVNTIGSKANDAEISQLVVKLKAEIDRVREQLQNIE